MTVHKNGLLPRRHAKTKTLCTDNIHNDISTKNKYALLTDQTDNVDFSTQHVTEKGATHSICDVHEAQTIRKYQAVQPKSKRNKHNNIFNLSNRQLKTDEGPVLELGQSVCPRTKYLNKEQTTNDFYSFIGRLKIFEYFHENPNLQDSQHITNDVNTERDILDWRKRNPDCYPIDLKEKRSEGLVSLIEKIISDSNESMKSNQGSIFNNLSKKQRSALESSEAD